MFIEDFSDNSGFIVTKDTIIHSWPLQRNDPVEHWDVIQEIPSEGLAHNNGMFGF